MVADLLQTLRGTFTPLRHPNFRLYLGAQLLSFVGTYLQSAAQGWVVWRLTESEAAVGVTTMFASLPHLVLGVWAGIWVDRLDRRKVLIVTQTTAMLTAFTLALLVATNVVQVWHIYALSLIVGVVSAFDLPSHQTFLGDLVGIAEVRKAITLNAMVIQGSRTVGPALAGVIVKRLGEAPAFWLNGLSYTAVIAALLVVKAAIGQRRSSGAEKPLFQLMQAVRFLRSEPRVQEMFAFIALNTSCVWGVILNLLPSVADKVLHGDAETFGRLLGASGAGALFGAMFLAPLAHSRRRSGLLVGLAAVWAGCWLTVFALSTWEPLSLLSMALAMVSSPIMFTTALSLVQMMAPDDMRARMVSLLNVTSFGIQPVAALIIGNLGERIGVQPTILVCGLGMATGAGALVALRPKLRAWEAPIRAERGSTPQGSISETTTYVEPDSLSTTTR